MAEKRVRNYWPHAIVLSIFGCVAACVVTIIIALKHPVQLENLYFEKSQKINSDINEIIALQREFEAKFEVVFNQPNFSRAGGALEIKIKPRQNSVSLPKFRLMLTRPETNERNLELSASYDNGILRTQNVKFPLAGRWQLMVKFDDANASGFYKFEFFVSDE